jgi:hypothetical protein
VIISPVLSALESLGYVDGKTVSIEYRDADGRYERLQEAANELVGSQAGRHLFLWRRAGPFCQKCYGHHSGRGRRQQ